MKIQIQITEIDNGWLVVTPSEIPSFTRGNEPQQQLQPVMHYCENYNDVVDHLKSVWPKT